MTPRSLVRSIPFWALVAGSAAAIGGGASLLVSRLGTMQDTLLDGTATPDVVYVGQIWAVFGGILVGVGAIGLALALALAAARTLIPVSAPQAIDWAAEEIDETPAEPAEPEVPAADHEAPAAETHEAPAVVSTPDPEAERSTR